MSDGKTHFADNDTLDYISDLEKQLAKAQAENIVLLEQNFAMNKTIADMRPVVEAAINYTSLRTGTNPLRTLAVSCRDYEAGEKP